MHLSVNVRKPLTTIPSSEIYYNLTQTTSFNCFIYPNDNYSIPTLELEVIASFITDLGVPRVCFKTATLPLRLVYESCPPLKDNKHKITLNLNETSVPLIELFSGALIESISNYFVKYLYVSYIFQNLLG